MIELPRAALTAYDIALRVVFPSAGRTTLRNHIRPDRDDAGLFFPSYSNVVSLRTIRSGLDAACGRLIRIASIRAPFAAPVKVVICGEHGASLLVQLCHIWASTMYRHHSAFR